MQGRTPFWPLFRHGLGIGWLEPARAITGLVVFLGFWFSFNLVPFLVLLNSAGSFRGNTDVFFATVLPCLAFFWFLFVVLLLALTSDSIWNVAGSEFLFTRAIDRRRLFRAKAAAMFLLMTLPMFLNLLLAPRMNELAVEADSSLATSLAREPGLAGASPAGESATTGSNLLQGRLVVRNGKETLAGWLLWWTVLGFFAAQGYCGVMARGFNSADWRMATLCYLPLLGLLAWPFVSPQSTLSLYQGSFLFFSRHPLLLSLALAPVAFCVESFCERRFAKLEVR